MNKENRIFVAGHQGLVGSAIVRRLTQEGYTNLILAKRPELDLLDQRAVHDFFEKKRIEYVFTAAARVGGIHANKTYPADFIYENLVIATNVIHAAAVTDVKKLLYLGSSCIYPKHAPQPMKEEYLLSGSLEPTNEAYAIAKIAGLKLCQYYSEQYGKCFISAMPTNLYGPGDSFHPMNSHVIPGMMRRFHEAKQKNLPEVKVWGSGKPRREFLFVDDMVDGLLVLMKSYNSSEVINVGSGSDITIKQLAEHVKTVTGYKGKITFDSSQPDGSMQKLLDNKRIKSLGWFPKVSLQDGLEMTYQWAQENSAFKEKPTEHNSNRKQRRVQDTPSV